MKLAWIFFQFATFAKLGIGTVSESQYAPFRPWSSLVEGDEDHIGQNGKLWHLHKKCQTIETVNDNNNQNCLTIGPIRAFTSFYYRAPCLD